MLSGSCALEPKRPASRVHRYVYMCNMHMQYDFTALNQVDKISSDFSYSFKSSLMFIAVFRFLLISPWIYESGRVAHGRCSKIWVPLKSIGFLLIFYTSKCKKPTILRSIWGTRLGVFSPKNSPTYFMMSLDSKLDVSGCHPV